MTDVASSPGVESMRSWAGFLAGFAVLCGVLLGTSAVDATGRWGLAILAAVLSTAVAVEMVHDRSSLAGGGSVARVGGPSRWLPPCRVSYSWCFR